MSSSYDILIVGAGPAGIAAAVAAARVNGNVGLIDDNPAPGGQIWRRDASHGREPEAERWLTQLNAVSVERLQGCKVFDSPSPGILHVEREGRAITLRYKKLILATGARERFLPFPGWTLPNVMGAGALDAFVKGGLPIVDKVVVVAGTGPLLLAVAAHLAQRGARIAAICEQTAKSRMLPFLGALLREPAKIAQGWRYRTQLRGAGFHTGSWPVAARGVERLESVVISDGRRQREIPCDYLACGFHLVPNVELAALRGCQIRDGFGRRSAKNLSRQCFLRRRTDRHWRRRYGTTRRPDCRARICGLVRRSSRPRPSTHRDAPLCASDAGGLHSASGAENTCIGRHHSLPLRGCSLRCLARMRILARGEAAHALRDGSMPGTHLRRCN
jgi:thioredoxin reductase